MAAPVPNLVDVFRGHVQIGQVEHHVVAGVFGILDRAQHAVGAPAQHYVESAEVGMALIAKGQEDDGERRDQLDREDRSNEAEGDGA